MLNYVQHVIQSQAHCEPGLPQGASTAVVPATLYLVATSLKLYYVYVVIKLKSSKLVCLSCLQDYSCATLTLSRANIVGLFASITSFVKVNQKQCTGKLAWGYRYNYTLLCRDNHANPTHLKSGLSRIPTKWLINPR